MNLLRLVSFVHLTVRCHTVCVSVPKDDLRYKTGTKYGLYKQGNFMSISDKFETELAKDYNLPINLGLNDGTVCQRTVSIS